MNFTPEQLDAIGRFFQIVGWPGVGVGILVWFARWYMYTYTPNTEKTKEKWYSQMADLIQGMRDNAAETRALAEQVKGLYALIVDQVLHKEK